MNIVIRQKRHNIVIHDFILNNNNHKRIYFYILFERIDEHKMPIQNAVLLFLTTPFYRFVLVGILLLKVMRVNRKYKIIKII